MSGRIFELRARICMRLRSYGLAEVRAVGVAERLLEQLTPKLDRDGYTCSRGDVEPILERELGLWLESKAPDPDFALQVLSAWVLRDLVAIWYRERLAAVGSYQELIADDLGDRGFDLPVAHMVAGLTTYDPPRLATREWLEARKRELRSSER